jgi:hypothetical protein
MMNAECGTAEVTDRNSQFAILHVLRTTQYLR